MSPNSLRVFETSARHLSFTAAARELRSTQSAVSQQIRSLEEQLGFPLFERIYRGVKLTEEGYELFISVQEGFAVIERTLDRLMQRYSHPQVTILTDFSFAAYWLMPRLPKFREAYPDIDVRIVTNQGVLDWRNQEVDIAILFCDESTLSEKVPLVFREEVFPVCSPGFLKKHGPIESLETLGEAPLLTLTAEQGQRWLDWPMYFAQKGGKTYRASSELAFNNYTLLIQAAIAGQGVGMGWRGLVDEMLGSKMLVGLPHLKLVTSRGYGLIDARPSFPGEAKETFRKWVLEYIR
ncbi:LysR family transcriptional regulator [Modicisalibacter xianhensis]|uniref:LysR family transcriptional regulator n=1 Tax=Modicisalibacter xianhensis TaxID=442341 RepID=A0A4R8FT02_9GAMM|nr:LysR substrate-binding domain-containing protein [Halomonas xianhensis]TDX29785.1 LysR family transcriptional regulator [Halomonas xianhensis]